MVSETCPFRSRSLPAFKIGEVAVRSGLRRATGGLLSACVSGLVIAWKLLRWASEIPPSEFVEQSECVDPDTPSGLETEEQGASTGLNVYRLYHQQVGCS